jgi:hypothetical protein
MKVIKADVNDEIIFNTIEDVDTGVIIGITSTLKLPTGNLNNILIDFNFINKRIPEELRVLANFNINEKQCIEVELRKITVGEKTYENACYIPAEVFENPCYFLLGLYGFALEGENDIKQRISLIPLKNIVVKGSYDPEATEGIVPTPTVFERYFNDVAETNEEMLQKYDEYTQNINAKFEETNDILTTKVLFYRKHSQIFTVPANWTNTINVDEDLYDRTPVVDLFANGEKLIKDVDYELSETINVMNPALPKIKTFKLLNNYEQDSKIEIVYFTVTIATEGDYEVLKGDKGDTPYIGENGNWFIRDVDTGVPSVQTPTVLTQAEYDSLDIYDENTLYYIREE